MSGSQLHTIWFNICNTACNHWVQTGEYQGAHAAGTHYDRVAIFAEDNGPCGYTPWPGGYPPSPDYAFYISYDGTSYNGSCGPQYFFEFRKGSWTSTPWGYGSLESPVGPASAVAENQAGAPYGYDRFGCTPSLYCYDAGYGIHLLTYPGHSFLLWTMPPAYAFRDFGGLYTYNYYYSFITCPTTTCP
jgi:hypothetical protein